MKKQHRIREGATYTYTDGHGNKFTGTATTPKLVGGIWKVELTRESIRATITVPVDAIV